LKFEEPLKFMSAAKDHDTWTCEGHLLLKL
jgi:hypothetical protein